MELEFTDIVIEAELAWDTDITSNPEADIQLLEDKLNGSELITTIEQANELPIRNVTVREAEE
jgi:hypothetical protein